LLERISDKRFPLSEKNRVDFWDHARDMFRVRRVSESRRTSHGRHFNEAPGDPGDGRWRPSMTTIATIPVRRAEPVGPARRAA